MSDHPRELTPDDELIGQLRRDWEAMGAEVPSPLDELNAPRDPATQAAAAWMREAWEHALPAEAPPMPLALGAARRRARRAAAWRARRRWLPAAAIAIAAASAGLWTLAADPAGLPPHKNNGQVDRSGDRWCPWKPSAAPRHPHTGARAAGDPCSHL